jgi:hypothetical protein
MIFALKLLKCIYRCSIRSLLVTRQTSMRYLNSFHVRRSCDSSTVIMACEICSRRGCDIGSWYSWYSTCPHRYNSNGVTSRDVEAQRIRHHIQAFGRFSSRVSLITIWKRGETSYCWKRSFPGISSFNWAHNNCSSIFW